MHWRDWYIAAYGDAGRIPDMDEAIFTCKLCGKNHLSTSFEHGVAKFPTTATTTRDAKGEWYILCKDHEQAKEKVKEPKPTKQCGNGNDSCGHGQEASLQGQAPEACQGCPQEARGIRLLNRDPFTWA